MTLLSLAAGGLLLVLALGGTMAVLGGLLLGPPHPAGTHLSTTALWLLWWGNRRLRVRLTEAGACFDPRLRRRRKTP